MDRLLMFLRSRLLGHIIGFDKQYGDYSTEKPLHSSSQSPISIGG